MVRKEHKANQFLADAVTDADRDLGDEAAYSSNLAADVGRNVENSINGSEIMVSSDASTSEGTQNSLTKSTDWTPTSPAPMLIPTAAQSSLEEFVGDFEYGYWSSRDGTSDQRDFNDDEVPQEVVVNSKMNIRRENPNLPEASNLVTIEHPLADSPHTSQTLKIGTPRLVSADGSSSFQELIGKFDFPPWRDVTTNRPQSGDEDTSQEVSNDGNHGEILGLPEPSVLEGINNAGPPVQNPSSTTSRLLPTGTHPPLQEFAGDFGFDICLESLKKASASNSWIFSAFLKQVFIKMNSVLNIRFKLNKPLHDNQYFIRALLVYQNNDHLSQPVSRCSFHWIEDDPGRMAHRPYHHCRCSNYHLAGHVMRCQMREAIYQYDPRSERHSVLFPILNTDPGTDHISAHYYFSCKTSCSGGMQRRTVQIIFTLEDQSCRVYGRQVLPVKICTCPKRDKDRRDMDFMITESQKPAEEAQPRKRSRPNSCNEMSENFQFDGVGAANKDSNPMDLFNITNQSLESVVMELSEFQQKELEAATAMLANLRRRHQEIVDIIKARFRT